MSLGSRFRDRAAELARAGRSRLYVELMRGAAANADGGGIVAAIFDGDAATRGSVPELRLLAALHHLVLSGDAPALARHYPSAGGDAPPEGAWAVAERTLAEHEAFMRDHIRRTVQTNEPGRCTALYGGLLQLSERYALPIRLLEIGASAGLNLNADRYRFVTAGVALGEPASPLEFDEPWVGAPVADPAGASARLRIVQRAGCDPAPIDPASADGRLALLSYIWPDEPERLARVALASEIAARHPVPVARAGAGAWLADELATPRAGMLTVVWQSVMRQYLDDAEWDAIRHAYASSPTTPLAWLSLEPGARDIDGFELLCRESAGGHPQRLAVAGYHGPPVRWR